MQFGRLIPCCLTNESEHEPTNHDTEDLAIFHKRPTISGLARLSRATDV